MAADPSQRPPDNEETSIPVESQLPSADNNDNDERDGIELHQIQTHEDDELDLSSASISSGEYRVVTQTHSRTSRPSTESKRKLTGVWGYVYRFWTGHVALTVPQKSNRDHFGKCFECRLLFRDGVWTSRESKSGYHLKPMPSPYLLFCFPTTENDTVIYQRIGYSAHDIL